MLAMAVGRTCSFINLSMHESMHLAVKITHARTQPKELGGTDRCFEVA